jgi:flagellin-like protein
MFGSTTAGDRRGVSPVVGIVLMIALTLLLTATVAAFALGLGESSQPTSAPTVAVGVEYAAVDGGHDELTLVHRSGDGVQAENLYLVVDGARCAPGGPDPDGRYPATALRTGTITAGMGLPVDGTGPVSCASGSLDLRRATVRLVWDSGVGTTRTYRTWHGPG